MHLSTQLDCDLVAVESTDELTLLVEITAPTPPVSSERPAATLQIVLDRSGSMAGDRLDGAKDALLRLVDRLEPSDNLGIVAFDDQVQVVVAAGPLTDKAAVKQAIAALHPGGSTDLSAGYLRGLQEARRVASAAGATVLLISDGHANAGVTDPHQLGQVAKEASRDRITTSSLGFGLGYDEALLAALAQGGQGNELFAENADTAVALIGGEVDGLLEQVAQAASLTVLLTPHVTSATLLNDLPVAALADGVMVELGSFYGGETRRLVLRLAIPGIAALGLAQVATLSMTHVSLPDLVQHTATVPVHVNVVPGDQAAGRIPDPTVRSEALFQETQRRKKDASRMLSRGDAAGAAHLLRASADDLTQYAAMAPGAMADELLAEAATLGAMAEEASYDMSRASKSMSYDSARKSRQRGRTSRGRLVLRVVDDPSEVLELEEWQLTQLARHAPAARALFGLIGTVADPALCAEICGQLPSSGGLFPTFFRSAAAGGGATVERA